MRRLWAKTELAFLRENYPNMPTWKISEKLDRPERSIYNKAYELGLYKSAEFLGSNYSGRMMPGTKRGNPTRFKKGHTPHNKGIKGWDSGGRSKKTRFKRGNKPQTWVPVGSEKISRKGILQRKISDTGYGPRDWQSDHKLLWEKHNGPVPSGHIVVFKNGNRADIRIENLELISRAENMRRNSVHKLPKPLVQVIQLRGALTRQINKREGKNEK